MSTRRITWVLIISLVVGVVTIILVLRTVNQQEYVAFEAQIPVSCRSTPIEPSFFEPAGFEKRVAVWVHTKDSPIYMEGPSGTQSVLVGGCALDGAIGGDVAQAPGREAETNELLRKLMQSDKLSKDVMWFTHGEYKGKYYFAGMFVGTGVSHRYFVQQLSSKEEAEAQIDALKETYEGASEAPTMYIFPLSYALNG